MHLIASDASIPPLDCTAADILATAAAAVMLFVILLEEVNEITNSTNTIESYQTLREMITYDALFPHQAPLHLIRAALADPIWWGRNDETNVQWGPLPDNPNSIVRDPLLTEFPGFLHALHALAAFDVYSREHDEEYLFTPGQVLDISSVYEATIGDLHLVANQALVEDFVKVANFFRSCADARAYVRWNNLAT
jgi:hypothetical protein